MEIEYQNPQSKKRKNTGDEDNQILQPEGQAEAKKTRKRVSFPLNHENIQFFRAEEEEETKEEILDLSSKKRKRGASDPDEETQASQPETQAEAKEENSENPLQKKQRNENSKKSISVKENLIKIQADFRVTLENLKALIEHSHHDPQHVLTLLKGFAQSEEDERIYRYYPGLLRTAILANADIRIITSLIDMGANVNAAESVNRDTALHILVREAKINIALMKLLLAKGADAKQRNKAGATPVHEAIASGKGPSVINMLIKNNVVVADTANEEINIAPSAKYSNTRDSYVRKAQPILHTAILNQADLKIFKSLLENGADINAVDIRGNNCLHLAVSIPNINTKILDFILEKLLEQGTDINTRNNAGATALHIAITNRANDKVINWLMNSGADIYLTDENGNHALHIAAQARNEHMIASLSRSLINQPHLNSKNDAGDTALHIAISNNVQPTIITLLVGFGANIEIEDAEGNTALHLAALMSDSALVDKLLIIISNRISDKQAYINRLNNAGASFLHLAITNDIDAEIITRLIDFGANIDIADTEGNSLLHLAAETSNAAIVAKLLKIAPDKQAYINKQNKAGASALHSALLNRASASVIGQLINNGAAVDLTDSGGNSLLHLAMPTGDTDILDLIIAKISKREEFINQKNIYGLTALEIALYNNSELGVIEWLINNGANVEAVDSSGNTPLHLAAQVANIEIDVLEALSSEAINLRTYINQRNNEGDTALSLVANHTTNIDLLTWLLSQGADINMLYNNNANIIKSAIDAGASIEVIRFLLFNGANPNLADNDGNNSMHSAVAANRVDLVELLLVEVNDIDQQNNRQENALHIAALKNVATDIIGLLLTRNIDIDAQNIEGNNALHCALQSADFSNTATLALLLEAALERKEYINRRNSSGQNVLHIAMLNNLSLYIIKYLVANGAIVQALDLSGCTPLHLGAKSKDVNYATLQYLLAKGLRIDQQDKNGLTALHYAVAAGGKASLIDFLLRAGANHNIANYSGATTLNLAIHQDADLDVIELLINFGANIEEETQGLSPLVIAILKGNAQAVKLLLSVGANVAQNSNKSPLLFALEKKNLEIIKLLLEKTDTKALRSTDRKIVRAIKRLFDANINPDKIEKILELQNDARAHGFHIRPAQKIGLLRVIADQLNLHNLYSLDLIAQLQAANLNYHELLNFVVENLSVKINIYSLDGQRSEVFGENNAPAIDILQIEPNQYRSILSIDSNSSGGNDQAMDVNSQESQESQALFDSQESIEDKENDYGLMKLNKIQALKDNIVCLSPSDLNPPRVWDLGPPVENYSPEENNYWACSSLLDQRQPDLNLSVRILADNLTENESIQWQGGYPSIPTPTLPTEVDPKAFAEALIGELAKLAMYSM